MSRVCWLPQLMLSLCKCNGDQSPLCFLYLTVMVWLLFKNFISLNLLLWSWGFHVSTPWKAIFLSLSSTLFLSLFFFKLLVMHTLTEHHTITEILCDSSHDIRSSACKKPDNLHSLSSSENLLCPFSPSSCSSCSILHHYQSWNTYSQPFLDYWYSSKVYPHIIRSAPATELPY